MKKPFDVQEPVNLKESRYRLRPPRPVCHQEPGYVSEAGADRECGNRAPTSEQKTDSETEIQPLTANDLSVHRSSAIRSASGDVRKLSSSHLNPAVTSDIEQCAIVEEKPDSSLSKLFAELKILPTSNLAKVKDKRANLCKSYRSHKFDAGIYAD